LNKSCNPLKLNNSLFELGSQPYKNPIFDLKDKTGAYVRVYILRAYVHVRPLARVSDTPVKREQIENIGSGGLGIGKTKDSAVRG